ncbi:MAG: hypothetical protein OEW67_10520, partial [Cyclobacteriaceae bacterium]|nr:hypothetical protein [Cyclobacteriaceae bacterium]
QSIYQLIYKIYKMKKLNQIIVLVLLAIVTLTSCKDNELPKGAYESGVLVVNEGNFLDADGSLSHYNPNTGVAETNVFSKVNNGAILGDVVQSVTVNNDVAYVIVNNSNKVEVVNAHTLKSITSFESMIPRYMTIANGKGYITEWGADFATPRVKVIDLTNHNALSEIIVESGAEQIVTANGKVYVANSWSNTISVIDPSSDKVVATIATDFYGISGLSVDVNDNVWGIYVGFTDWSTGSPVPANDGAIVKINTTDNTIASSTSVGLNISSKVAMNSTGDKLLFMAGNSVYEFNTVDLSSTEIINESAAINFYGIGVDPATDIIYAGDAKGFQGNGVVFRYNSDGSAIDSFNVGRGPNGFVFK